MLPLMYILGIPRPAFIQCRMSNVPYGTLTFTTPITLQAGVTKFSLNTQAQAPQLQKHIDMSFVCTEVELATDMHVLRTLSSTALASYSNSRPAGLVGGRRDWPAQCGRSRCARLGSGAGTASAAQPVSSPDNNNDGPGRRHMHAYAGRHDQLLVPALTAVSAAHRSWAKTTAAPEQQLCFAHPKSMIKIERLLMHAHTVASGIG